MTSNTKVTKKMTVAGKNKLLVIMLILGVTGALATGKYLYTIEQFNRAVTTNYKVNNSYFKFEAKFSSAYQLAKSSKNGFGGANPPV